MIDDEVASENYMVREKSIQYPGGGGLYRREATNRKLILANKKSILDLS